MANSAHSSRLRAAASAAVLLGGIVLSQPAFAFDVIIGGQAQLCSQAAKAGQADANTLEYCTAAILSEPLLPKDLAGTYVNRGTLFLVLQEWDQAISDFDIALAKMPDFAEAIVNRGAAYLGQGKFSDAVTEISRGIDLNPGEPEKAYANRAAAKWRLDDVKGAYVDFLKAQALNPTWDLPRDQLTHFVVQPAPVESAAPPALTPPGQAPAPRTRS